MFYMRSFSSKQPVVHFHFSCSPAVFFFIPLFLMLLLFLSPSIPFVSDSFSFLIVISPKVHDTDFADALFFHFRSFFSIFFFFEHIRNMFTLQHWFSHIPKLLPLWTVVMAVHFLMPILNIII